MPGKRAGRPALGGSKVIYPQGRPADKGAALERKARLLAGPVVVRRIGEPDIATVDAETIDIEDAAEAWPDDAPMPLPY